MLCNLIWFTSASEQKAAAAPSFADPLFKKIWDESDAPGLPGRADRSWIWGPTSVSELTETFHEGAPYRNVKAGNRLVQYFDKARMEINAPARTGEPATVSFGLLVVELVGGTIRIGNNDYEKTVPSILPIAGDTTNPRNNLVPTYAVLNKVANVVGGVGTDASDLPKDKPFAKLWTVRG
jgi:hypothetical protein